MVNDFNFVTPESEGICSESILEFLDFFKELRINIHSFMMVKNGNIVAEGYYKPFDKDTRKRIYSCSKSITSFAVGKLYGEGLVDLNAPIVSYFPEIKNPHPIMAEVTVEDVLKMTVPHIDHDYCRFPRPDDPDVVLDEDWTERFFSGKGVGDKPHGKLFDYNSLGSSLLGSLVKKVSGKNFLDYLRPEFDKIGVSRDIGCIETPDGVHWGASGVLATTRDFAKMGELMLNLGEYKGEQLLPRDYMERAVSKMSGTIFGEGITPDSYGYGYQMWVLPHGYCMQGMRGQVVYCFPDKNFMVVITSNEPDYAGKYYYAASRLYKSISDTPVEENSVSYKKLCDRIAALKIDRSFGEKHSVWESCVGGKTYVMNDNDMKISSFVLDFGKESGCLRFVKDGEEKTLKFGYGEYVDTLFPDKNFYGRRSNVKSGREFRVLSTGSWDLEDRLIVFADISDETPGSLGIVFEFYDDKVALQLKSGGEGILFGYEGVASGRVAD